MKWFEGTIPEAIKRSQEIGSLFVVYIYGDDENSSRLNSTWDDEIVSQHHLQANCIAIRLHTSSEQGKQFSQIYPVVMVPCVFYIGKNGVPLEVSGGYVQPVELSNKLTNALQLHNAQAEKNVSPVQQGQSSQAQAQTHSQRAAEATVLPSEPQQSGNLQPVSSVSSPQPESAAAEQTASEAGASGLASQSPSAASSSPGALDDRKERALELLAKKRAEKEREQEEKEKQDEINRRKLGQEMSKLKQWKEDRQKAEVENSYKKQKEEERLARERVRAEIERDRQERAAKYYQEKTERENAIAARNAEKAAAKAEADTVAEAQLKAARMENARVQFRLPDGSAVTNTFKSSENLASVRSFILQRLPSSCRHVTLTTVYPKRVFNEADMPSTLLELGLVPSAILVVLIGAEKPAAVRITDTVWWLLAPLLWIWGIIYTFLFARPLPAASHQSQSQQTAPPSVQGAQPNNSRQPNVESSSSARQRTRKSDGTKRRVDGNIHRLSADDSDDETATWNGNSTQQM